MMPIDFHIGITLYIILDPRIYYTVSPLVVITNHKVLTMKTVTYIV